MSSALTDGFGSKTWLAKGAGVENYPGCHEFRCNVFVSPGFPHFVFKCADRCWMETRLLFCTEGELTNEPRVNPLRLSINSQEKTSVKCFTFCL